MPDVYKYIARAISSYPNLSFFSYTGPELYLPSEGTDADGITHSKSCTWSVVFSFLSLPSHRYFRKSSCLLNGTSWLSMYRHFSTSPVVTFVAFLSFQMGFTGLEVIQKCLKLNLFLSFCLWTLQWTHERSPSGKKDTPPLATLAKFLKFSSQLMTI